MIYRAILAKWAQEENPNKRRNHEGALTAELVATLNADNYHIYFFPNYPTTLPKGRPIDGTDIDVFQYVFADFDLKDKAYPSKGAFIDVVHATGLDPSFIVDSGNGVHVYWEISDLDAMSFLKLQRRIMRKFNTDDAVAKICQLMRVPGTVNPKHKDAFANCTQAYSSDAVYTCEDLDKFLPPLTHEDETYCQTHFDKTYKLDRDKIQVDDTIPLKFAHLLKNSPEVKEIWAGEVEDRSAADYRLGHLMFADGFTKEEAMSVLVNTAKALERAPVHRVSYAENIVDKIWTFEITKDRESLNLSYTVREILDKHGEAIKGERFPCWTYLDNTVHGFRLGQVIGLVAGSGVGKTAMALNMFQGFVQNNPDYDHFFIPLEQPANEIADRWRTMCGTKAHLHDKVHVMSNYADDGSYRSLSFDDIKSYLLKFQTITKRKIGCVVIDHIGALKKGSRDGRQSIEDICHQMKAFAIETNTLLVMQSQAPREKAGIGDLELNKDAAYGTVYFEAYVDYLITLWQPLKRAYKEEKCPTVTAYKFGKVRHKHPKDKIREDVRYRLYFDGLTGHMKEMTQDQETSFDFFNKKCVNARKQDRKTELVEYTSISMKEAPSGKTDNNQDSQGT